MDFRENRRKEQYADYNTGWFPVVRRISQFYLGEVVESLTKVWDV